MLRVGSCDAPEIIAVVRKLFRQTQAKQPVRLGRDPRVVEVVGIFVSFVAKIKPSLRKLMYEQRSERPNVAKAFVLEYGSFPCVPDLWPEGIGRRTHSQQI